MANTFCGVTETIASLGGTRPKWNKPVVSWAIQDGNLGQIEPADILNAFGEALNRWSVVCGLRFEHNDTPNADIVAYLGHPDNRSGGVLADMELPDGTDRQRRMRIDKAENWGIFNNSVPARIDLIRVLCHELGHAIGLSHLDEGALLAPMYGSVTHPQSQDIYEAQLRYGPASVTPGPVEPVEPGDEITEVRLLLQPDGSVRWTRN